MVGVSRVKMKIKALQIVALLGVMGGVSTLLVSTSAPAQAGEQRLHSSTKASYGLIPPGQKGEERGGITGKSTSTKSASNSKPSNGGSKPSNGNTDGPQLEDPGLPSYDGGAGGAGNPGLSGA